MGYRKEMKPEGRGGELSSFAAVSLPGWVYQAASWHREFWPSDPALLSPSLTFCSYSEFCMTLAQFESHFLGRLPLNLLGVQSLWAGTQGDSDSRAAMKRF